jgi:hypothetical protein
MRILWMKIRSESEKINRNSIFYQSTESQLESTGVDWVETEKMQVDSSRLSHFDMSSWLCWVRVLFCKLDWNFGRNFFWKMWENRSIFTWPALFSNIPLHIKTKKKIIHPTFVLPMFLDFIVKSETISLSKSHLNDY